MEELKCFYQYMLAFPKKSGKFAKDWAKGLATLKDRAAPGQIVDELSAILRRRNGLQADAERLAKFYEGNNSATEFVELSRETRNNICAELDALFVELCRALDAEGLTLTGGEISALKRQGWPEHLAAELDAIKRGHRATIPERERLGAEDAAALWDGLTRQGLISGPAATFAYYLGQLSNRKPKGQESALCWRGTPMQFAYFIKRFAAVQTARLRSAGVFEQYESAGNNTAALCLAFGKDPDKIAALFKDLELQEENAKERQAQAAKERRAVIDAVFNTLPSLNK